MNAKSDITEEAFVAAAATLGCEVAAIKAVAEVESPRGPFLPSGEPTILFERHVFHRLTNGRWSKAHPDISNPSPGGYGPSSRQHERLQRATALDRSAGLRSASWGAFQIMGFNHVYAGHATLQGFINAMYRDADAQLQAFVQFIRSQPGLTRAIRDKDWAAFARLYNGPDYRRNRYDEKMAAAYAKFSGGSQ